MVGRVDRRTAFRGVASLSIAGALLESPAYAYVPGSGQSTVGPDLKPGWASVGTTGAKGDGVTPDSAAIQLALTTNQAVWVPPGDYLIDEPIILPSFRTITFAPDAIFKPASAGMTVFQSGEASYSTRVIGARIDAGDLRGVTAFDLRNFRHAAEIQHADIVGCEIGIHLRELCWDTVIHMPWIRKTTTGIMVGDGCNAVDIIHPALDGCQTAILIKSQGRYPITTTRVSGGYIQNGSIGLHDLGSLGLLAEGIYFEGNATADILLDRAIGSRLLGTQHFGDLGRVAIEAKSVDGLTIFDPLMGSGGRVLGLYQIDAASKNVVRFDRSMGGGMNLPIGETGSSSRLVAEVTGSFEPRFQPAGRDDRFARKLARWSRISEQLSLSLDLEWTSVDPQLPLRIAGVPPAAMTGQIGSPSFVQTEDGRALAVGTKITSQGVLEFAALDRGPRRELARGASGAIATTMVFLD